MLHTSSRRRKHGVCLFSLTPFVSWCFSCVAELTGWSLNTSTWWLWEVGVRNNLIPLILEVLFLLNSSLTPMFHARHWRCDQCPSCSFSISNPPQIALRCSLCISYLHWINASHWWQVFKSMFINGFFKCLKIKSLTYWWSFGSCPGREKELELERTATSCQKTTCCRNRGGEGEEEEEAPPTDSKSPHVKHGTTPEQLSLDSALLSSFGSHDLTRSVSLQPLISQVSWFAVLSESLILT